MSQQQQQQHYIMSQLFLTTIIQPETARLGLDTVKGPLREHTAT